MSVPSHKGFFAAYILSLELTTSPPSPHVGSDCSSVGAGAAFVGFIGGVLLTAALGYGVAVAVVYRAKREVTLDLRSG